MTSGGHSFALRITRFAGVASVAVGVALLTGCASVRMQAPTPSGTTVEKLRSANLAPAATGRFALAAGKPEDMDKFISLRGVNSLQPAGGSFSQQLKDTLIAELTAAGLHDPASKHVIEAELTDNQADPAIGTGTGRLAAKFRVVRAGVPAFDKEFAVDAKWESSFIGAIAIPTAAREYSALYKALVAKLLEDGDFKAALAR